MAKAFHAGQFFEAIGYDFGSLEKSTQIVNADVLDAWFDPSPLVVQKIRDNLPFLIRTSPPSESQGLRAAIAQSRGIPEENILVGGGSSDLIFLFFPHMTGKNERVLIIDPMYGEYRHILENVLNTDVRRHNSDREKNFQIDILALISDIHKNQPAIVVLVNPNSPTGQYAPKEDMLRLLSGISKKTIVVVDETYIEYVGRDKSLEKEILNFDNLVIIKSMSKAYALSGLRVGYLAANKEIVERLENFSPPWAVGLIGQVAAVEALKDDSYYQNKYEETHRLRDRFVEDLSDVDGLKIYSSTASFFLAQLTGSQASAERLVQNLRRQNIYIRNADSMSSRFHDKFLRIAVKDEISNRRIKAAMTLEADRNGLGFTMGSHLVRLEP